MFDSIPETIFVFTKGSGYNIARPDGHWVVGETLAAIVNIENIFILLLLTFLFVLALRARLSRNRFALSVTLAIVYAISTWFAYRYLEINYPV